jgi:hypothetical protein
MLQTHSSPRREAASPVPPRCYTYKMQFNSNILQLTIHSCSPVPVLAETIATAVTDTLRW